MVSYIISVILSFDIKCTSDTESKHTSSKAILQHILKKYTKNKQKQKKTTKKQNNNKKKQNNNNNNSNNKTACILTVFPQYLTFLFFQWKESNHFSILSHEF